LAGCFTCYLPGKRLRMAKWVERLLAAIGVGGRKAEADVSYDPAQRGPRRDDTTDGRSGIR
jgi:hypothetical protein